MSRPPTETIVDWYDRKTDFLVAKYGPGPRIHYHTGLAPADVEPAATAGELRAQLWRSQEDMLARAVRSWNRDGVLGGAVLDVGCGLGGTALYLAARLGSRVTALSPVSRHLQWVEKLAHDARVAARVDTLLGDAHALDGPARFDAALSFGATTYFDRALYFVNLARVVRPGGWVFIEDTFLGRAELAAPFNAYWTSDIGWIDEYTHAAAAAGFALVDVEDVSRDAAGFWRLSAAYTALVDRHPGDHPRSASAPSRSIEWQEQIHRAYLDGGLRNLLVRLRRAA